MSKKVVSWEKYEDIRKQFKPLKEYEKENEDSGDTEEENEEFDCGSHALMTSWGILPLNDGVLASDHFDFWIMHTNFDITEEVIQKISIVKGVESLEPLSRYRARVGFPIGETIKDGERVRMFDSATIKKEIEQVLTNPPEIFNPELDELILSTYNEEVFNNFASLKNGSFRDSDYWAALILPNGQLEYTATDSFEEFTHQHKLYEQTAEMTGGIFICHEMYKNGQC